MKHIKSVIIAVSLILSCGVLAACGDDDEPEVGISLPSGTATSIVLGNQDILLNDAVVFISTGDWSAEIYPANSSFEIVESKSFSNVDWLEVTPYQGGAGEIHCALIAKPNMTYDARYAVIKVNSPTNSVQFNVTQLGATRPGGDDTPVPNPGDEA